MALTEKRFTIEYGGLHEDIFRNVLDNQMEYGRFNCYKAVELLNKFADENEQLKKELEKISLVNELSSMDLKESEHELWKENEQLKQQLKNLRRLVNEAYMEGSE